MNFKPHELKKVPYFVGIVRYFRKNSYKNTMKEYIYRCYWSLFVSFKFININPIVMISIVGTFPDAVQYVVEPF